MPIIDPWNSTPDEQSFARAGAPIVPANSDMATVSKGLLVCATGDVVFIPVGSADGDAITITGAPAGMIIPYFVRQVKTTTTATVSSLLS
jgi:hypothetical protein